MIFGEMSNRDVDAGEFMEDWTIGTKFGFGGHRGVVECFVGEVVMGQ